MNARWKVEAYAIGAIVLISLGGYFAGIGPFFGARVAQASHRSALAAATEERDTLHRQIESETANLVGLREKASKYDIRLSPASLRHERVSDLAGLANEMGLTIEQVTPRAAKTIPGARNIVRIPITVTGRGNYAQVAAFFARMHQSRKDFAADSFKLRSVSGPSGPAAQFSVEFDWFAQSDDSVSSAPRN